MGGDAVDRSTWPAWWVVGPPVPVAAPARAVPFPITGATQYWARTDDLLPPLRILIVAAPTKWWSVATVNRALIVPPHWTVGKTVIGHALGVLRREGLLVARTSPRDSQLEYRLLSRRRAVA